MAAKRTIRPSVGYEGLRQHAVLREADLRDLLFESSKRSRPRDLLHIPMSLLEATPHLAAHLAEHGGFRPRVKTGSASDAKATRSRLHTMHGHSGPLVMVTAVRHDLAGMALKDRRTAAEWAAGHTFALGIIAPGAVAFEAVLQAGGLTGQLHDHTVLPLDFLNPDLQAFALAAPAGPGGGAIHPASGLHFVCLGKTTKDRAKVASYLSRDPDGRFDLPDDHPAYLQAHEDAIVRKLTTSNSPRLSRFKLPRSWR